MTVDITLHRIPAQSYGPLQVLKSAAGFYVGTLFNEGTEEHPFLIPGSRDSDYFPTFNRAKSYLDYVTADDEPEEDDGFSDPSELHESLKAIGLSMGSAYAA